MGMGPGLSAREAVHSRGLGIVTSQGAWKRFKLASGGAPGPEPTGQKSSNAFQDPGLGRTPPRRAAALPQRRWRLCRRPVAAVHIIHAHVERTVTRASVVHAAVCRASQTPRAMGCVPRPLVRAVLCASARREADRRAEALLVALAECPFAQAEAVGRAGTPDGQGSRMPRRARSANRIAHGVLVVCAIIHSTCTAPCSYAFIHTCTRNVRWHWPSAASTDSWPQQPGIDQRRGCNPRQPRERPDTPAGAPGLNVHQRQAQEPPDSMPTRPVKGQLASRGRNLTKLCAWPGGKTP